MERLEYKSNLGEIKDVDMGKRQVVAIFANWNLDHHNDVIQKGAFSKTLMERRDKILFLNQHSWQQPHGYFKELSETDEGLLGVSHPLPNTTYSNDALELYASGIVKEHSIGFETVKSMWDEETEIRTIKEIKLYEGSNVTLGANSNTPFLGFKAMAPEEITSMVDRIVKTLRNGNLSDDTCIQLEFALKQLYTESYKAGKLSALNQPNAPSTDPTLQTATSAINQFLKTL